MENIKSCLFSLSILENQDELSNEFLSHNDFFLQSVSGLSERESIDKLNQIVSSNPENHRRICIGLLYIMLTDQSQAPRAWRFLGIVSRDNHQTVTMFLDKLITLRFEKLLMPVKMQIIWIFEQLASSNLNGAEKIFTLLMQCIRGGDLRTHNIVFTEQMIKVVTSQMGWITSNSFAISLTIYTFLRLIPDHITPQVAHIRQAEVAFTVKLIRENFAECINIGRDFVRLLQGVTKIPEFIQLWRDILYKPQSLGPNFSGILQILSRRTPRRFLATRLTPEMETNLSFLATQVKLGSHQKYQKWFSKKYFSNQESQTLVCDCIRYLCGVIHPTNEMLNSNIVPRWALIWWLLTTITSNVMATQAKLALFYDWFFYDKESDGIMNIEPGVLVMNNALKSHPYIAATLMDFLIRMTSEFCPELSQEVWTGINNSFTDIIEKKVVPDFVNLVNHPKLDAELRVAFRRKYPELCPSTEELEENETVSAGFTAEPESRFSDDETRSPPPPPPPPPVPLALDKSVDSESEKETPTENGRPESIGSVEEDFTEDVLKTLIEDLDPHIREEVRKFAYEPDVVTQRTTFGNVISRLMDHPAWTRAKLAAVAKCLHISLAPYFGLSVLDDENQVPLHHGIFQLLSILKKEKRPRVWKFLSELYSIEPRVGYHLLFYLHNRAQLDLYREFVSYTAIGELKGCLTEDLRVCQEEDGPQAFYKIIQDIYLKFPSVTTGNANILHLIVSCIDAQQLHTIICNVMSKKMKIFNIRTISALLRTTLDWETFEQYCVWQLLSAESVPSETVVDVLKDIKDTQHYELFSSMLVFLKSIKPSEKLVKKIIFLQSHEQQLVIPITVWWIDKYSDGLVKIIEGFVSSAVTNMDDKRLNILFTFIELICNAVDSSHQIYEHKGLWTQLRDSNNFISAQVKKECPLVQRTINDDRFTRKTSGEGDRDSDDDEEEEEEEVAPPPTTKVLRKRKREVILDSDED